MGALVAVVLGIYLYGRSEPETQSVRVQAELHVPLERVWSVLSAMEQRPAWREPVERVGRIADDAEGREVWRELDASGDRLDLAIVERRPHYLALEIASPEQVGTTATWTYDMKASGPSVTQMTVTEHTGITNPLWRGLSRLLRDDFETVETEVHWLADHLGTTARIDRL